MFYNFADTAFLLSGAELQTIFSTFGNNSITNLLEKCSILEEYILRYFDHY